MDEGGESLVLFVRLPNAASEHGASQTASLHDPNTHCLPVQGSQPAVTTTPETPA